MSRFVRLKHQDGMFRDPQTGFKVSLREIVELTEPVGMLTKRWLVAGGLVEVDPPEDVEGRADSPMIAAPPASDAGPESEATKEEGPPASPSPDSPTMSETSGAAENDEAIDDMPGALPVIEPEKPVTPEKLQKMVRVTRRKKK